MTNKISLAEIQAIHKKGQFKKAKKGYLTLLKNTPDDIELLDSLSILCVQQTELAEAKEYLQKALSLQPAHPTLSLHLANVFKMQGLYSQAITVLKNALTENPCHASLHNNLGTLYYAEEKWGEAIKNYERAINLSPNYIDAYYNLGLTLTKLKKNTQAIAIYQKLLDLSPEHFAARFHLGCTYMEEEQYTKAQAVFLRIAESHPHHAETQINLATCFLKKGLLDKAKFHYLHALEITPDDTQILFNLGVIHMKQGNIDSAIQHYQQAVRIHPDFFAAHNNLGVAFLAKNYVNFALQHFQEALRIQPHNKTIQYTVNMLSQKQPLLAAPADYVKTLFDAYADHYDPHLLQALDYQLPSFLYKAASKFINLTTPTLDILDLGCGTGLSGIPFKKSAKFLMGVDLSEKMLEVAAAKNMYDQLITADLNAFLATQQKKYDLVITGDVLVYIGELNTLFKDVYNALHHRGLFVFNTEISEDKPFKMNQSGRFSHHKDYLDRLATSLHFKILYYQTIETRKQMNAPVMGHLYVLQPKTAE